MIFHTRIKIKTWKKNYLYVQTQTMFLPWNSIIDQLTLKSKHKISCAEQKFAMLCVGETETTNECVVESFKLYLIWSEQIEQR